MRHELNAAHQEDSVCKHHEADITMLTTCIDVWLCNLVFKEKRMFQYLCNLLNLGEISVRLIDLSGISTSLQGHSRKDIYLCSNYTADGSAVCIMKI